MALSQIRSRSGYLSVDGAQRRTLSLPALAVCAVMLFPQAAGATEEAEKRGAELARAVCADCHEVGPRGLSPNPKAPPFHQLIGRLTAEGIEDVLLEEIPLGHPPMPQWRFTPEQVEELLAYIESLEGR